MKTLILTLALAASASAAGFQFHLDLGKVAHAIKARHDQVPASRRLRRVTGILAGVCNAADAVTTKRGFDRVPTGCEANPRLQAADGCHVDKAKFGTAKGAVLASLVSEELINGKPLEDTLNREATITNIALAVSFCAVSVNNELQK